MQWKYLTKECHYELHSGKVILCISGQRLTWQIIFWQNHFLTDASRQRSVFTCPFLERIAARWLFIFFLTSAFSSFSRTHFTIASAFSRFALVFLGVFAFPSAGGGGGGGEDEGEVLATPSSPCCLCPAGASCWACTWSSSGAETFGWGASLPPELEGCCLFLRLFASLALLVLLARFSACLSQFLSIRQTWFNPRLASAFSSGSPTDSLHSALICITSWGGWTHLATCSRSNEADEPVQRRPMAALILSTCCELSSLSSLAVDCCEWTEDDKWSRVTRTRRNREQGEDLAAPLLLVFTCIFSCAWVISSLLCLTIVLLYRMQNVKCNLQHAANKIQTDKGQQFDTLSPLFAHLNDQCVA